MALAPIGMSGSLKELLMIVFIVLVPTVPLTFAAWTLLGRRRSGRAPAQEIESGRSPATPFAVISVVGSVIAVSAMLVLLLVVAVRAAAT
jgi:hypothetical protein